MKKILYTILLSIIITYTHLCATPDKPDVHLLWAGNLLPKSGRDEFLITTPMFREVFGRYAVHYAHCEPRAETYFNIILTRSREDNMFYLALYDSTLSTNEPFDNLEKMSDAEKLKAASAIRAVDLDFAQALYEKVVKVLANTRYGDTETHSNNPQYFYLSAFAMDAGYMCAMTRDYRGGKTSKKIVELGKLLREYILVKDKKNETKINQKIEELLKQL